MDDSSVDIAVSLHHQMRSALGSSAAADPESYVLSFQTDIVGRCTAQSGHPGPTAILLGQLAFQLVRVSKAIAHDINLADVFDGFASDPDAGEAVFNASYTGYRAAVQRRFDEAFFADDLLVLERLKIARFARGQRLGLSVLEQTIRDFSSGCSLVMLKPFPLRAIDGEEAVAARDVRQPPSASVERAAVRRLRAYYTQLGFERIPRSEYFALCPAERQPTALELALPHMITVSRQQLEAYQTFSP